MKKFLKKKANQARVLAVVAASGAMSASAAVDSTVTDSALVDIATLGGLMLALTIAVTTWAYLKRTAR